MFTNLIESASHQKEMARKGRFFLATLAGYALLFACAGIATVYAYDAQVENQDLEMLVLIAPVESPFEVQPVRRNTTRNNSPSSEREESLPVRTDAIARIDDSTKSPDSVSAQASKVPEIPRGPYTLGDRNTEGGGIYDPNAPSGPSGPVVSGNPVGPVVDTNNMGTPPVRSDPPKPKTIVSKGVITGLAISKPTPAYPPIALKARAQGPVNVQILVDESGNVISARAVSGHVLLRQAAEQAAMRTRFSPTKLSEVPVKVTGTITFNFVLTQ